MPGSNRTPTSQSKHDQKVSQQARELERKGYGVSADVPGYSQPPTVSGFRPDIRAKKGDKEIIIEIETPDSVNSARDVKQQAAFLRAARRNPNLEFKREIAK